MESSRSVQKIELSFSVDEMVIFNDKIRVARVKFVRVIVQDVNDPSTLNLELVGKEKPVAVLGVALCTHYGGYCAGCDA